MGQKTESRAFSVYLSATLTTDVQAVSRKLPAADLTKLSGIGLARDPSAPTTPSDAAFEAVDRDPTYRTLVEAAKAALQTCIQQHGSLPAAKACRSLAYKAYTYALAAKTRTYRKLLEPTFRQEREDAVRDASTARPISSSPDKTSLAPSFDATTPHHGRSKDSRGTIEALKASTEDRLCLANVSQDDLQHDGDLVDVDDEEEQAANSALLEMFGRLTIEQTNQAAMSFGGLLNHGDAVEEAMEVDTVDQAYDEADQLQDEENHEEALDKVLDAAASLQYRQHGILRHDLSLMVGTTGRSRTRMDFFSPTMANVQDVYNSIVRDENISGATVMDTLLGLLTSETHVDSLPKHWLSPLGNFHCIYCNEQLAQDNAFAHVSRCVAEAGQSRAKSAWNEYLDKLPSQCAWTLRTGKPCGAQPDQGFERQKHFHKHFNHFNNFHCFWGNCKVYVDTLKALGDHAWSVHQIVITTVPEGMYTWCHFCLDFVWEPKFTQARTLHFEGHLDTALANVKSYGYSGLFMGVNSRQMLSCHCIFCLHDSNLDAEERIGIAFKTISSLYEHLIRHVDKIGKNQLVHCPASSAAGAQPSFCRFDQQMTAPELMEHLEKVHYAVPIAGRMPPSRDKETRKRKRQAAVDSDDEESNEAPGKDSADPAILQEVSINVPRRPKGRPRGSKNKGKATASASRENDMSDAIIDPLPRAS